MFKNSKIPIFFWAIPAVSLLVVAGSIAYYFMWFLPSKEKTAYQIQQTQKENVEIELKTRQNCQDESRQKAKEKLEKLIDAGLLSQSEIDESKKALDKGLAKKADVDYYFNQCLEVHGLK